MHWIAPIVLPNRNPESIEHSDGSWCPAVYGLALGYEDLNDHEVCADSPLALLVGKQDLTSEPGA